MIRLAYLSGKIVGLTFRPNQHVRDEGAIIVHHGMPWMSTQFPIRFLGQHDVVDEILSAIEQGTALSNQLCEALWAVLHAGSDHGEQIDIPGDIRALEDHEL